MAQHTLTKEIWRQRLDVYLEKLEHHKYLVIQGASPKDAWDAATAIYGHPLEDEQLTRR